MRKIVLQIIMVIYFVGAYLDYLNREIPTQGAAKAILWSSDWELTKSLFWPLQFLTPRKEKVQFLVSRLPIPFKGSQHPPDDQLTELLFDDNFLSGLREDFINETSAKLADAKKAGEETYNLTLQDVHTEYALVENRKVAVLMAKVDNNNHRLTKVTWISKGNVVAVDCIAKSDHDISSISGECGNKVRSTLLSE